MRNSIYRSVIGLACVVLPLAACEQKTGDATDAPTPVATRGGMPGSDTILLSLAQFSWEEGVDGKRHPKPGAAKLVMLSPGRDTWDATILEDPDSRVFHKAACVTLGGEARLMTIGGTDALLKLWRLEAGKWRADTLWHPSFGGKWDRLRDFEIGDVDGDGEREIVVATHDQGVIAVLSRDGQQWRAEEVFKQPDTFVHEIEIGDVDGDGRPEFYATPSAPNKADVSQAGGILAVRYEAGKGYSHDWVVHFKDSHAKEILVADIDGDGKDELYAAIEATRKKDVGEVKPLEVVRYTPGQDGKWTASRVAALPGAVQSRVLLPAPSLGPKNVVITTMKGGIYRLVADGAGPWETIPIDAASSGFEHAAGIADLDGDGKPEIYVAADDQDEVRQYRWDGETFTKKSIYALERSDLTWNILPCVAEPL